MKLIKGNKSAIVFSCISAILCYLLWKKAPGSIAMLPIIEWVSLAAIFILLLSPISNIRLPNNNPEISHKKYKALRYFSTIIIVQACLIYMLFSMITILNHLFIPGDHLPLTYFSSQPYSQLIQNTFFPWPTVAILTTILAYYSYKKKQTANMKNMLSSKHENKYKKTIVALQDIAFRTATYSVVSTAIAVPTLITAEWIMQSWGIHLFHGVSVFCFACYVALIITIKNRKSHTFIKKLNAKKIPTLAITALFSVLLFALVIAYHLATPYFLTTNILGTTQWFHADKWQLLTHSLSVLWWIGWCLPVALCQAHLSSGLRLRHVIIAPLILPTLLTSALYYFHHHPQIAHITYSYATIGGWQVLLSLASLLILLKYFTGGNRLSLIYYAEIEANGTIRPRNLTKPLYLLAVSSAIIIYLLSITGVVSTSILYFIQLLPVALFIYLAIFVFFIRFLMSSITKRKKVDSSIQALQDRC